MIKKGLYITFFLFTFLCLSNTSKAQEGGTDTFFLAKKKGLLGRFGRSISRTPPEEAPERVENPFLQFKGAVIRSIETVRLGFEYDIDDTTRIRSNLGITLGKAVHKNTSDQVIRNNLFFKKGSTLFPYLLAENERYLRDLTYIKDARILVEYAVGTIDSVDVVVLTRDVFSIGGNFSINSKNKGRVELKEENFLGSGMRMLITSYYENPRDPKMGIGGEIIRRNIGGSFIDWVSGYRDFKYAFTSGRNQETSIYTSIEKPLVTAYIPSTGALQWSYQRTRNVYDGDSLYQADIKYAFYNVDAWFGYGLDSKRSLYTYKESRVHRFVAIRGFKQHFLTMPAKYKSVVDYRFTDVTGGLASLNIFRQVFYKTNFIYGFGRKEDLPEGFSTAITGGYVKRQETKRPYGGLDLSLANFRKRGNYTSYTLRVGGYYYKRRFEDVDLLFDIYHFTRLRKLGNGWYNRVFIGGGISTQVNPVLNAPLFLNSAFGLLYFSNGSLNSDLRGTFKGETVFYNTTKILGFRLAPFVFADAILLKPTKQGMHKSDLFTAIGGGLRTRNENLVFGTVELKGYFFPRVNGDMRNWKIELSSNVRFRFRSNFITRPDFVMAN